MDGTLGHDEHPSKVAHPHEARSVAEDDVSAHRTRTNRRPVPPLHSAAVAEIDRLLDDVAQDRN